MSIYECSLFILYIQKKKSTFLEISTFRCINRDLSIVLHSRNISVISKIKTLSHKHAQSIENKTCKINESLSRKLFQVNNIYAVTFYNLSELFITKNQLEIQDNSLCVLETYILTHTFHNGFLLLNTNVRETWFSYLYVYFETRLKYVLSFILLR